MILLFGSRLVFFSLYLFLSLSYCVSLNLYTFRFPSAALILLESHKNRSAIHVSVKLKKIGHQGQQGAFMLDILGVSEIEYLFAF